MDHNDGGGGGEFMRDISPLVKQKQKWEYKLSQEEWKT